MVFDLQISIYSPFMDFRFKNSRSELTVVVRFDPEFVFSLLLKKVLLDTLNFTENDWHLGRPRVTQTTLDSALFRERTESLCN
jgi:hypothetical protein